MGGMAGKNLEAERRHIRWRSQFNRLWLPNLLPAILMLVLIPVANLSGQGSSSYGNRVDSTVNRQARDEALRDLPCMP